jgi:branched-chain amino acid transport system ATP-binding protein
VKQIYESLAEIRSDGTAVVLVEQDIARAASVADRVICLLKGRITLEQRAGELDLARLNVAYFGEA